MKNFPVLCAACAIVAVICGCWRGPAFEEKVFAGETQGTTYTVRIVSAELTAEQIVSAQGAITDILALVDRLMSTYRPDSEVSEFNRSRSTAPFPVAPELIEVLEVAQQVSRASGGAFDVTVGPLVRAWGFGPEGQPEPPPPEELERLKKEVGYQDLKINPQDDTIRKTRPGLSVDLSGIAQGYTVDRLAAALTACGIPNYMIEIGGEVKALGHNVRGVPWRIGVEKPVPGAREIQLVLSISNTAVSTSGDYRQYREVGGVRISHTIDPRTGRPIEHALASVTIVNPSCMLADAYCTAIMVLGPEDGYRLAVEKELAALLLIHAGEGKFAEKTTPAFQAFLEAAEAGGG